MSDKFQRVYVLKIEGNDDKIYSVADPFTLDFTVSRNVLSSQNTGYFRIYNLKKDVRNNIYHDVYDSEHPRTVTLDAGYENRGIATIFSGKVKQAKSFKDEGTVNFITEIEAYDDVYQAKAFSNFTLDPADQVTVDQELVINTLISDLETFKINGRTGGLKRGAVSDFSGGKRHSRGRTITGSTWEALQTESEVDCFIDNGRIHVLKTNDVFEGDVPVISSITGLLASPKKSDFLLSLELLFEPGLRVGQQVYVQSDSLELISRKPITSGLSVRPPTNGVYKIIGLEHRGTISGAVGGKCKTEVKLLLNIEQFNIVKEGVSRV